MCWDSNHRLIADDTIPALNPPDESGVPKGYDTLFNLANGLYYITITDRLGCYQDKQIKVNDPINPKMTLRANGFKKVYDGTPVSLNNINRINVVEYDDNWKVPERAEYYVTSDQWRQLALRIGDSLIVSLSNPDMMIKDVDSVRNKIVGWSIKDAETGKDKTCLYHFYPIDSCIVIVPATLTLFTGSATKEYDGTELTSYNWNVQGLQNGEHVWCMPSASLTDVGSIENSCEIDWGNPGPWDENIAQQKNYTVINHFGTLTVTPNTQPVTITAGSSTKTYDGAPLINGTISYSGLPNGFYVEATTSGSQTDIGTSQNVVNSYVIKNANGEDKTAYFTNVTTVSGTLTVEKADLFITTPSATKPYDGTALTAAFDPSTGAGSISGLASNESITVTTTGSQTDVGESDNTYTIDWGTTNPDNYEIRDNLGTLTVTSATITVTADNKSKTYGDSDPTLTATVVGAVVGDAIAYSLSREAGEDANTYVITPTGDTQQGNYSVTYEPGTLTITRATATVTADDKEKIAGEDDPEFTATVTGLHNGDAANVINYHLERAVGEVVGSYTITPSGDAVQSNYDVTYVPGTLTITNSNAVVVRIAGHNHTAVYDKTEHAVSGYDVVSISNPNYTEADFVFNGTADASRENVGTAYMGLLSEQFFNNNGNFDVTFIVTDGYQTITPAPVTVSANNNSKTYGNTDPELTATVSGTFGSDVIDFTLARAAGENAGNYPISVTLIGENPNYQVTTTGAIFTINKKAATVVANNNSKTYGATDPTLTATVSGTVGNDAIAYSLYRAPGDTVGTYPISVTLGYNPNYQVTSTSATFTINKKAATIAAVDNSKTYGDTIDPELTATVTGTVGNDTIAYTLSRAPGDTVGAYPITVTPGNSPNYEVTTIPATFTINKKAATVAAINNSKTYGNPDTTLTATVTGTVGNDTIAYTLSRAPGDNVGTYPITVTLGNNPNYKVTTTPATFTINKKAATVAADSLSKVYGDTDPTLTATVSGTVEGDVIDFTLSRAAGENAGTYPISVTLGNNPNYQVTSTPAIFTINQKLVMVSADNKSKTYGDTDPEFTATVEDVLEGDTLVYTLVRAEGENVGTYSITVNSGNNRNYAVMGTNGILTINKRSASVAANNNSKTYGNTDPTFTATVTGTVSNDAIAYTLAREEGENVGTYPITVTLGNNPNYELTTTPGAFSINKKSATVVANNKSKTYSSADPTLTATVTGTVSNDAIAYTLAREEGEDVGQYPIAVTPGINPNYEVTTTPGSFSITPATVIVMANDKVKVQGTDDPELTATVAGLRNGDPESLISYTISREEGEDAGTYAIIPAGTAKQGNYQVTYLPGKLTILDESQIITITITGNTATMTYNGSEQSVTGYAVSIPEGAPLTEADIRGPMTAIAHGTDVKTEDGGKYMMGLTPDQFSAQISDYYVAFDVTDGWLKITKKSISIAFDSSKVYDGEVFTVDADRLQVTGLVEGQSLTGRLWTESAAPGVYETHAGSSQAMMETGTIYSSLSVIDATSSNVTTSYVPVFDVTLVIEGSPCVGVEWQGHNYDAVKIGTQCWLAEDLHYAVGNYTAYREDADNESKFGYLYSWYTAVEVEEGNDNAIPGTFIGDDGHPYVQGICPNGWAVGNETDFAILNATAGSTELLKDMSTQYWYSGYEGTSPNTGFNARGGGWYNSSRNRYEDLMTGYHFWHSDSTPGNIVTSGSINYYCDSIVSIQSRKTDKRSVRCIRKVSQ